MNYLIKAEGQSPGPWSAEEVTRHIQSGLLGGHDWVCEAPAGKWTTVDTVPEFRRVLQPPANYRAMARWSLWLTAGVVIALVVGLCITVVSYALEHLRFEAGQAQGISNCRKIITAMRLYSSDQGGSYPDSDQFEIDGGSTYSNDSFRKLFVAGYDTKESIFGCPMSVFQPDGKIGSNPSFSEALKPGENHWAKVKGLNDSASGSYPLIFENPAEATWPPKWTLNPEGNGQPGRAWPDGTIIIGMIDSSVSLQKLEAGPGPNVGLMKVGRSSDGRPVDLFTQNDEGPGLGGPPAILNVAK